MNIFEKRPFSLILCVMLGGFSLFVLSSSLLRLLLLTAAGVLLAVSLIPALLPSRQVRRLTAASAVLLLLSFLAAFLYFDCHLYINRRYEGEVTATGRITETVSTAYGTTLTVDTSSIEGSRYHTRLLVHCEQAREDLLPGTTVSCRGVLYGIADRESDSFSSYYTARGYAAGMREASVIQTDSTVRLSLSACCATLRSQLCARVTVATDTHTGGLLATLLLGEREGMSGQLQQDFTRLGISHLLALSGMHFSILTAALDRLLRMLRVRRRARVATTVLFSFGFMALTGFSASVCRAGVMLILSSLFFLLFGDRDSVTSLFLAVFLILLLQPASVYDLGLWLSALSTLGVLMAVELMPVTHAAGGSPLRRLGRRLMRETVYSLTLSLFALLATLALSALCLNSISLVSPLSTLLFSLLCEAYMYLGMLVLIFGSSLPLFATGLSALYRLISSLAARLSGVEGIAASAVFPAVRLAALLVTVLLILFLVLRLRHRRLAAAGLCVCLLITLTLSALLTLGATREDRILYRSDGGDDRLLLTSSGTTAILDMSAEGAEDMWQICSLAEESGSPTLDYLYLSHYTARMADTLPSVVRRLSIRTLLLPRPENQEETALAADVIAALSEYRTEVLLLEEAEALTIGELTVIPLFRSLRGDGALRAGISILTPEATLAYLSCGASGDAAYGTLAVTLAQGADTVIFGAYGRESGTPLTYVPTETNRKIYIQNKRTEPATDRLYPCDIYYYVEEAKLIH